MLLTPAQIAQLIVMIEQDPSMALEFLNEMLEVHNRIIASLNTGINQL